MAVAVLYLTTQNDTERVILLKAGKGLASDVIANCCIQNFSGDITKCMQSPKTNIFSESATVALFWKASKFNLHSLGKKAPKQTENCPGERVTATTFTKRTKGIKN